MKGIFLNPSKANCSIYESGLMIYTNLLLSKAYMLDYLEIDEHHLNISGSYDFYAFNYHHATMGWLDTTSVRRLPGIKLTFVLETLPKDPFVLCSDEDFDAYCVLDPTINCGDNRVYAFPRPLEVLRQPPVYHEPEVPVLGSFGFATPGKGFELLVDAVNREFDEAVIKINIPPGTHADDVFWKLHNCNYSDYLGSLCAKVAKSGIHVIVTHDYMSKPELIDWCGQNTLNCFLYNRNQPGLSATTDQAITSGRPLAISTNETFRHIHPYVQPYPFRSLKESIALSQLEVLRMQHDWAPEKFAAKFEAVLRALQITTVQTPKSSPTEQLVKLRRKEYSTTLIKSVLTSMDRIRRAFRIQTRQLMVQDSTHRQSSLPSIGCENHPILIVSHKEKRCGIYQYAVNLTEALTKSSRYSFSYVECSNEAELNQAITQNTPKAIIYNYYPATMPWLTARITRLYTIPQLGIVHEVTQEDADHLIPDMFDFYLCPDPTLLERNPIAIKTKRLIPPYINMKHLPEIVTIGSFGFGFGDKGFERIVETVQGEYDRARIVLHLPYNDIVDRNGASHAIGTAKRCRRLIKKPGIELVIDHRFFSKQELLDFLASNTLNAFFYDTEKCRGISSTIEHALAVQRPLAITKCGMFRHVLPASPSICIDNSSLRNIIANGIAPLVSFYNEWSEANFIKDYECIFDRVFTEVAASNGSSKG